MPAVFDLVGGCIQIDCSHVTQSSKLPNKIRKNAGFGLISVIGTGSVINGFVITRSMKGIEMFFTEILGFGGLAVFLIAMLVTTPVKFRSFV